jgi:outer membrane receptor protein involved in Fe transport
MPGVPTHSAKLGLSANVTTGLTLGATLRAQSAQYLRGDEANLLAELPGFAVVNAQARQRINRRLTGVAEVQNLFGAEYYTFGVLGDAGLLGETFEDDPRFYSPGAPRALWVGLEVRF